jgi:hypothetical protein
MIWVYQVFLGQTMLDIEKVREILSIFPRIVSCDEEIFNSLAGRTRNIRAYVEVAGKRQMTDEQLAALRALNLEMDIHLFHPYWEPGELEALQEKERKEEKEARAAYLEKNYPGRRYYLCYFRQQRSIYSLSDDGPITVSWVHPTSYPPDQYEEAKKRAKELEQARYEKKDYNLQIEARLAATQEDAQAGRFLDE